MATPRCDEFEDLRKYFMRSPAADSEVLRSILASYASLLRLAKSLETELVQLKQGKYYGNTRYKRKRTTDTR